VNAASKTRGLRTLSSLIDDERISTYQLGVIALCALIAMLDGFDTQAIAFTAPAIAVALNVPVATFGPVFAIGLLGGMLGAFGFGLVADRTGRKFSLIVAMIVFALGSLLTARANSANELMLFRFITGLGLGGAIPSIISMTAEFAPRRLRATLVTTMFCGFPLGAIVGALSSAHLVPAYGWAVVFSIGGVLPLLLLPLVIFAMPESIRWLSARRRGLAIGRILSRMRRADSWDHQLEVPERNVAQNRVAALFAAGFGGGTILLWTTLFLSLLIVYLLVNWIPTIAQQTGRGADAAAISAAMLNFGGIVGSVCLGRLIDRFGSFKIVCAAYIGGAACVLALGVGTNLTSSIYWLAAVAGFLCIGAQLSVVAIAAEFYPLELRATGVGWAMGIGRLGAITGPLIGGLLLGSSDYKLLFVVLASASLVAGLTVLGLTSSFRANSAHH
jgi:AAHS family 4-hydroxybenzoate transporter-like MFS transporter